MITFQAAFFILPAFKHLAQTLIFFALPSSKAFTILIFGRKRRLLIPVMRWPTPPFILANPRLFIVRPAEGLFPHTSHILDIINSSMARDTFMLLRKYAAKNVPPYGY